MTERFCNPALTRRLIDQRVILEPAHVATDYGGDIGSDQQTTFHGDPSPPRMGD